MSSIKQVKHILISFSDEEIHILKKIDKERGLIQRATYIKKMILEPFVDELK